jgi:hypothetical protein
MMIPYRYIDFAPIIAQEKLIGLTVDVQFESLQDTVVRANDWIVRHGVKVVNIETVILPAPLREDEYSTGDNGFRYIEQRLVQIVRVWYSKDE